ncbi:hypothetical protein FRC07_003156 [Ceratobasidium sp. 392]|nr:hypothetical protein FRC07_003156 [Ceratobasidium sp. 392]
MPAFLVCNHEFDFGQERFDQLVEFCNFNWVLSNIKRNPLKPAGEPDLSIEKPLNGLHDYCVFERAGLRIGVIGLMSKDALQATNTKTKAPWICKDMGPTCKELAARLRKPKKELGEGCDLVIALTHAEHEEDIKLAREVGAYPANCQAENIPVIDIIFGGHNHNYYLGNGVKLVGESTDAQEVKPYRSCDNGDKDLLIIKSGTDFYDLSKVEITVDTIATGSSETPEPVWNKLITEVMVTRYTGEDLQGNPNLRMVGSSMAQVLARLFQNEVLVDLDAPAAKLQDQAVDRLKEDEAREGETVTGNWIADSILKWYKCLESPKSQFPHVHVMTAGSIRAHFTPKSLVAKKVTEREVIDLFTYENTLKCIDLKGKDLKAILNTMLSKSDRGEDGKLKSPERLPVVSGMRIKWSSRKPAGDRVEQIWISDVNGELEQSVTYLQELEPDATYRVLTNDYLLADGNEYYNYFKNGTPRKTYAEIPTFQALRYYIHDMMVRLQLERLVTKLKKEPESLDEKQEVQFEELLRAAAEKSLPTLDIVNDATALDRMMDTWGVA